MTLSQALCHIGDFALLAQEGDRSSLPPLPCKISSIGPLCVEVFLSTGERLHVIPERLSLRGSALPTPTPQSQEGLYLGPLGITSRSRR